MLEVKNIFKTYSTKGGVKIKALDDVSVTFPETGMVFLLGKSGSGKSTLLNVAGGLDKADSGEIIVKGKSSKNFSTSDFDSYRNTCVGFVFQEYNILNEFTIEQNIALALELQHKRNDKKAINALLEQVDLKGLGKRKPNTLSGGQKQRVAIARALIKEPEIIMADEPTGALDSNTGKQVLETLKKLSATKLVIVVSHDRDFAEIYGDRIIELADGKIIDDVSKTCSTPQFISDNVQMVSSDTVSIKNAESITEDDVKSIVDMLRKNGGEAIITASKNDLKDVKHACKINDSGAKEFFTETTDVKIHEYDGRKTKFIRSHLPISNAMRIGASGMKSKPIRLIFTIILSVIAFVMFGLLSAVMFYDKDKTFIQSIDDGNIPVLDVIKEYQVTITNQNGDDTYSHTKENSVQLTDAEVESIKSKFSDAFGAVSFSNTGIRLDDPTVVNKGENSALGEYYDSSVSYATSVSSGFSKGVIIGRYPSADDEVCISTYTASVLLAKYNGISDKNDLLDKTVKISDAPFKIVGIFDSGDSALEPYSKYKENIDANDKDNYSYNDVTAMKTLIADGYHNCVIFNENIFNKISKNSERVEQSFQELLSENNQYRLAYYKNSYGEGNYGYYCATYLDKSYISASPYETYYIGDKKDIGEGEAVLSYDVFSTLIKKYNGDDYYETRYIISQELGTDESDITDWLTANDDTWYNDTNYEKYTMYKKFKELTQAGAKYNAFYIYVNSTMSNVTFFVGTDKEFIASPLEAMERVMDTDEYTDEEKDTVLRSCLSRLKPFLEGTEFEFNVYYEDFGSENVQQIDENITKLKIAGVNFCRNKVVFLSDGDNNELRIISESHIKVFSNNTSKKETKYIEDKDAKYDVIFADYGGQKGELSMFSFEFGEDDSRYFLRNSFAGKMVRVNMIVEAMSQVFMWVGIVVGAFAMILLSNFISSSISYKKKDIGILRAVGARGADVFKIFFSETFLIDLICLVFAIVGCFWASATINKEILSVSGGVSLIVFGIKSIAVMIGIALASGAVATFLPVYFASKKPPVESIRAL